MSSEAVGTDGASARSATMPSTAFRQTASNKSTPVPTTCPPAATATARPARPPAAAASAPARAGHGGSARSILPDRTRRNTASAAAHQIVEPRLAVRAKVHDSRHPARRRWRPGMRQATGRAPGRISRRSRARDQAVASLPGMPVRGSRHISPRTARPVVEGRADFREGHGDARGNRQAPPVHPIAFRMDRRFPRCQPG